MWSRCGPILAIAAVGFALAAQVPLAFTRELSFDEAYNLQIPLNLYLRGHYQTWYHSPHPFDPHITTGPPVLLPVAAMFFLLGAQRSAASLVMVIFFIGFLWVLYRLARQLHPAQPYSWFAGSVILITFVPEALGISAAVQGEFPGIFFFLTALTLMHASVATGERLPAVVAGAALGLAVLSKLVLLLLIPGFLLALVLSSELRRQWLAALRLAVIVVIGFLLVLILWHAVKLLALGSVGYVDNLAGAWQVFRVGGSGVNLAGFTSEKGLRAHLTAVAPIIGMPPILIVLGLLLISACAGWTFSCRRRSFVEWALLLGTAGFWLWWFRISTWLWYRHLVPGYILYAVLVGYLLDTLAREPLPSVRARGALVCACVAGAMLTLPPRVPQFALHEAPALQTQRRAAEMIRRVRTHDPGATFWGFGWYQAPEISFLAQLPLKDVTREAPGSGRENYLVVDTTLLNALGRPELAQYARTHCSEWIFRADTLEMCHLSNDAPLGHEAAHVP